MLAKNRSGDQNGDLEQSLFRYYGLYYGFSNGLESSPETWIATVPNGKTSGVLQQSTLRTLSTAPRANIVAFALPSTCSGSRPFSTIYNSTKTEINNADPETNLLDFLGLDLRAR